MKRMIFSRNRGLRAVLFVVLLAAQSFAVAHEFTHWDHSVQELCATCLLSNQLDAPGTSEHQYGPVPADTPFKLAPVESVVSKDVVLPYAQRAPPRSA